MLTTCIRCGKTRIPLKSWTESVNGAKTLYTTSVCPDKECQKIVEDQLQKKNDKAREIQEASLARRANFRKVKKT